MYCTNIHDHSYPINDIKDIYIFVAHMRLIVSMDGESFVNLILKYSMRIYRS